MSQSCGDEDNIIIEPTPVDTTTMFQPVDCVVSAWSEWSSCTEDCGGGMQTRSRIVITPAANGGLACPVLEEQRACNEQDCVDPMSPLNWQGTTLLVQPEVPTVEFILSKRSLYHDSNIYYTNGNGLIRVNLATQDVSVWTSENGNFRDIVVINDTAYVAFGKRTTFSGSSEEFGFRRIEGSSITDDKFLPVLGATESITTLIDGSFVCISQPVGGTGSYLVHFSQDEEILGTPIEGFSGAQDLFTSERVDMFYGQNSLNRGVFYGFLDSPDIIELAMPTIGDMIVGVYPLTIGETWIVSHDPQTDWIDDYLLQVSSGEIIEAIALDRHPYIDLSRDGKESTYTKAFEILSSAGAEETIFFSTTRGVFVFYPETRTLYGIDFPPFSNPIVSLVAVHEQLFYGIGSNYIREYAIP